VHLGREGLTGRFKRLISDEIVQLTSLPMLRSASLGFRPTKRRGSGDRGASQSIGLPADVRRSEGGETGGCNVPNENWTGAFPTDSTLPNRVDSRTGNREGDGWEGMSGRDSRTRPAPGKYDRRGEVLFPTIVAPARHAVLRVPSVEARSIRKAGTT